MHTVLFAGGTQGLELEDMFDVDPSTGVVKKPKLKTLNVPVRAVVIPIGSSDTQQALISTVRKYLQPLLGERVWYQKAADLHATLYHFSTHLVR